MNIRSEGGWTLVELVCTLSLMGLITSMAYPQLISFAKQMEEELFVKLLVDELYYARTQAIGYEQDITVQWQSRQMIVRSGTQELRQLQIPAHLRLLTNFPNNAIRYHSSGQAKGGTIQLLRDKELVAKIVLQVASGIPKVIEHGKK